MPWLHHPSYVRVRNELIDRLSRNSYRPLDKSVIIFLCGAAGSERRDALAQYLRTKIDGASVFYAEDVWKARSRSADADALILEKKLAELADIVIVIVESPGSIAELGAFSLHAGLCKKLLPILDLQYKNAESFINTGPVRTIVRCSAYAPVYTPFNDAFLLCASEVEERIKRFEYRHYSLGYEQLHTDVKHLLNYVIHLVSIIYPTTVKHLGYYIRHTLGRTRNLGIQELLDLAVSLRILACWNDATDDDETVFYAPVKKMRVMQMERFDHCRARARLASALEVVPRGRAVLERMEKELCHVAS